MIIALASALLTVLMPLSGGSSVFNTITELLTNVTAWFTSIFEMITSSAVMPWVLIGVGISLLGILIKFVRKMVWGA